VVVNSLVYFIIVLKFRLAATYHSFYEASMRLSTNSNITMCLLLLLLWSHEMVYIGRPKVDHSAYQEELYGDSGDNTPTMDTLLVQLCGKIFFKYDRIYCVCML
jgi:hypothetical protein